MEPILMAGGAIAAIAWLRKRNAEHGAAGALPSPMVDATPINPEPNRMSSGQTPPVSSEMSLRTSPDLFVQKPLQPASVWNPTGAVSQGSGTSIADDGRAFLPAIPAKTVPIADVGSVQQWTDLTMTDPQWTAPTVLTQPQPVPVQSVTIAAPEVAAPAPKAPQSYPAQVTYERGVLGFQAEP
jgi:hypothetical protein